MKKNIFLIIVVIIITLVILSIDGNVKASEEETILFIGNSKTYYNNLPRRVWNFARLDESTDLPDLKYEAVVKGGKTLNWFYQQREDYETKLLSDATFKLEKLDDDGNVDTIFTAQEKTTESAGTVEFTDLLVGKYQITETKAPEGYELNTEVTEVEVTKVNRELNVTVKNREKLVLPETGETNYTIIVSGIGIAVMLIALVILKFPRNKKENI